MTKISFIGFMTLAASTLVIVTACSSDDDKATASSGGTAAIAQAECAQENRCSPTTFGLRYASVDDCATVGEQSAAPEFALPGVTITNGQLEACANAITAAGCNQDIEPTACEFTGSLADGASCISSIQCSSGYCKDAGSSSTTTTSSDTDAGSDTTTNDCGKCTARVGVGAACDGDNACTAGLGCDEDKHTCATLPAKGAACTESLSCASGLKCIKAVCADPVAAGGACSDEEDDCATGLACANGTCSNGADQYTVAALGQPCGIDITAQKFIVCKLSSCVGAQGSQKCVANATAGQPCSDESSEAGGTLPGCANGLECTNGTCATEKLPTCN